MTVQEAAVLSCPPINNARILSEICTSFMYFPSASLLNNMCDKMSWVGDAFPSARSFFLCLIMAKSSILINFEALMTRLNGVPGKSMGMVKIPEVIWLNVWENLAMWLGSSILRNKWQVILHIEASRWLYIKKKPASQLECVAFCQREDNHLCFVSPLRGKVSFGNHIHGTYITLQGLRFQESREQPTHSFRFFFGWRFYCRWKYLVHKIRPPCFSSRWRMRTCFRQHHLTSLQAGEKDLFWIFLMNISECDRIWSFLGNLSILLTGNLGSLPQKGGLDCLEEGFGVYPGICACKLWQRGREWWGQRGEGWNRESPFLESTATCSRFFGRDCNMFLMDGVTG